MRLVAVAVVLVACGDDPSLRVVVVHPPATAASVNHTAITVYESESQSCEDIEFGVLSDAQLRALEVSELIVDHDGAALAGGLAGISRTGKKLIVGRGFDAANALLTAGCAEHQDIVEGDTAEVDTVDVAALSVAGINPTGTDPFGLDVTVTDPAGSSIAGRRVGWRVFGPAGTTPALMTNVELAADEIATWQPSKPACTNADGRVRLRPVPPSELGGFAFDLRASWASQTPPLFSSFTRVSLGGEHRFTPAALQVSRWCALRAASATDQGVVCLEDTGTIVAAKYTIAVDANGTATFTNRTVAAPIPQNAIAVVSVERGGDVRDVYAVTADGRVTGVFSPSVPIDTSAAFGGPIVTDAVALRACAVGQQPKLVLKTLAAGGNRIIQTMADLSAAPQVLATVDPAAELEINNAGCVTELDPDANGTPVQRQVIVVDTGRAGAATTIAHFECGAAACKVPLPIPRAGVGFTGGTESRLAGAFFDASGAIIAQWVLLPAKDGSRILVEKDRMAAASFPQHIATGLLDADAGSDLVWSILNAQQDATSFQIAYERRVGTDHLTALSGSQDVLVVDLQAGDVTGDGIADLLVLEMKDRTGAEPGAAVIPAHVPVPTGAFQADTPCAR